MAIKIPRIPRPRLPFRKKEEKKEEKKDVVEEIQTEVQIQQVTQQTQQQNQQALKSKSLEIRLIPRRVEDILARLRLKKKKVDKDEKEHKLQEISTIRKLISNEKIRLLHTIKDKKPNSIYQLAKVLSRDLKSVRTDIKLLRSLGIIDFKYEKDGQRILRAAPYLKIDKFQVMIEL